MERYVSLTGLMVGVALSACAAAVSRSGTPATGESRALPALGPASTDACPEHRPSYACASSAPRGRGLAQPADPRRSRRPSHLRTPTASVSERVYAEVDRRTRTPDATLRATIAREILAEAARAGLDPLLVLALIHVESSFDPDAVSRAGAVGLMQVREATMLSVAARFGLRSTDPLDPIANIQAGVRYLAGLMEAFGDTELALMAYNAGPGRIRRYKRDGGVPERFRAYAQSVAREFLRLGCSLDPLALPARGPKDYAPTRARLAAGPALEGDRTRQFPPGVEVLPPTGPKGVEHSREPGHGLHPQRHEQTLASELLAEGLARLEGS